MFSLHYKTRRFFCRVGFTLACLAPTAGVLAWASWLGTAAHVAALERAIEQEMGCEAALAAVSYPRPGVTILEGVELLTPRTRERLAYFPRLECWRHDGQRLLIATGPEIDERAISELSKQVEASWRHSQQGTAFVASSLTLHRAAGKVEFKDVDVRALLTTTAAELRCQANLRNGGAQPMKLHIVRPSENPNSTLVQLDSADTALPCAPAASYLPCVAHWGDEATFQGSLNLSRDNRGWHGDVQGTLKQIDLARAIGANFSHRIEGPAEMAIQRARISDGRLQEISGSIDAGPGLIGPSLRIAAAGVLEMTASDVALQSAGLLEFEQLAFDFTLDSRGLLLKGRCAQGAPGALLVEREQLLLGEPRRQPQPVASLIRALAPPGTNWVPSTHEAAWLVQLLPQER